MEVWILLALAIAVSIWALKGWGRKEGESNVRNEQVLMDAKARMAVDSTPNLDPDTVTSRLRDGGF